MNCLGLMFPFILRVPFQGHSGVFLFYPKNYNVQRIENPAYIQLKESKKDTDNKKGKGKGNYYF